MIHISTSIEGLENLSNYRLKKMAPYFMVDGVPCETAKQVREALRKAKAEGLEVIPAMGCDNYDEKGYCKGHKESES